MNYGPKAVAGLIDDLLDGPVSPENWEAMDAARIRAGGSWSDMKMIRVRFADDVLEDSDFTILELGIRKGHIVYIKMLQMGVYSYMVKDGPFLLWTQDEFLPWFLQESPQDAHPRGFRQLFHRGKWVGNQAALTDLNNAFTSE